MIRRIRVRRGPAADWSTINPILSQGEFGFSIDDQQLKIGNGSSPWNALRSLVHSDRSITIQGASSNQVLVAGGSQTLADNRIWSLSLPQDIHSGATPSFQSLYLTSASLLQQWQYPTDPSNIYLRLNTENPVGGRVIWNWSMRDPNDGTQNDFLTFKGGNVGIREKNPVSSLDIKSSAIPGGTDRPTFRAYGYDSDSFFEVNNNASNSANVRLTRSDAATVFSVDGHTGNGFLIGNLGIGVNPAFKLHVSGNVSLHSSTNYILWGTNASANPYIQGDGANNLYFGTGGSYRMMYSAVGNFGVGPSVNPDERLTIRDGNIKLHSLQNISGQYRYIGTEFDLGNGNNRAEIRFGIDGADTRTLLSFHVASGSGTIFEGMRLTHERNLLVGTTVSSSFKTRIVGSTDILDLSSSTGNVKLNFGHSANGGFLGYTADHLTGNLFYVTTGSGAVGDGLVMDNNGFFGVRVGSPTHAIDVNGNIRVRTLATSAGDFLTANPDGVFSRRTAAEVRSDLQLNANFIQNQNSAAQSASFKISGSGVLGGPLQIDAPDNYFAIAPYVGSAGLLSGTLMIAGSSSKTHKNLIIIPADDGSTSSVVQFAAYNGPASGQWSTLLRFQSVASGLPVLELSPNAGGVSVGGVLTHNPSISTTDTTAVFVNASNQFVKRVLGSMAFQNAGNFIENRSSGLQTANYRISGTGEAAIFQTLDYNNPFVFGNKVTGGGYEITLPTTYTGGWAVGNFFNTATSGAIVGGYGMFGSNTTPARIYMGFGALPWNDAAMHIHASNRITVGTFVDDPNFKFKVVGSAFVDNGTFSVRLSNAAQGGVEEIIGYFGAKDFWSNLDAQTIQVGYSRISSQYVSAQGWWDLILKTSNTERLRITGGGSIVHNAPNGSGSETSALFLNGSNTIVRRSLGSMAFETASSYVTASRLIDTQHSLAGGGSLTSNRTLSLVNDVLAPGASMFYGTNNSGVRGWYSSSVAVSDMYAHWTLDTANATGDFSTPVITSSNYGFYGNTGWNDLTFDVSVQNTGTRFNGLSLTVQPGEAWVITVAVEVFYASFETTFNPQIDVTPLYGMSVDLALFEGSDPIAKQSSDSSYSRFNGYSTKSERTLYNNVEVTFEYVNRTGSAQAITAKVRAYIEDVYGINPAPEATRFSAKRIR